MNEMIIELFNAPIGLTVLNGGIILALMSVPIIVSIGEDSLKAVPDSYREAAEALGATRWQVGVLPVQLGRPWRYSWQRAMPLKSLTASSIPLELSQQQLQQNLVRRRCIQITIKCSLSSESCSFASPLW